jgi:hypothetical protein
MKTNRQRERSIRRLPVWDDANSTYTVALTEKKTHKDILLGLQLVGAFQLLNYLSENANNFCKYALSDTGAENKAF